MNIPETNIDWVERSKHVKFKSHPFIQGKYRQSVGGKLFHTYNPATNTRLAQFSDCGADEVDIAVCAAREVFRDEWRGLAPEKRKAVLTTFASNIRAAREELALFDCLEMGMPISLALMQVDVAVDYLLYYVELSDKIYGWVTPSDISNTLAMTYHEPRGVVGIISPWNYPLLTAMTAIAPALAAGNTVVAKPSEIAPSSVLKLAEIATQAGVPAGALNVVIGRGETAGKALAKHIGVNNIHFTGSTRVGRELMVYAGRSNGKYVVLETGGKSPQIIFEDAAELEGLGASIAESAFVNTGQLCVARTRLIVHEAIRDQVLEAISAAMKAIFVCGNPLHESVTFGPLSCRGQFERVTNYLTLGNDEGATLRMLETGGVVPEGGCFLQPAIFTDAANQMRVAQEEIFGPVMVVLSFRTDEEAVAIANDVMYGLAATAWTRDLGRARRLMRDLDAGRVDIRTVANAGAAFAAHSAEPFGDSGHGVLGGMKGLDPFLRFKGVQIITE